MTHIANYTKNNLMVCEVFKLGKELEFKYMTLIINSETGKKLSNDTNTLQFIEDHCKRLSSRSSS